MSKPHRRKILSSNDVLFFSFFCFLFVVIKGEDHLNNISPFGKYHSLNDVPSPHGCHRTVGNPLPSFSSSTVDVAELYVSSTLYVSNQQLIVAWNKTLTSCVDDFVGIYFIEIPLLTGESFVV